MVQKTSIENIISENGLEDKIILLGFKDNPYPYIKKADFLFLPSLHETFSMVVSEAHILGTRVIASDIPIMHEVLYANDVMCANGNYIEALQSIGKKEKATNELGMHQDTKRIAQTFLGLLWQSFNLFNYGDFHINSSCK